MTCDREPSVSTIVLIMYRNILALNFTVAVSLNGLTLHSPKQLQVDARNGPFVNYVFVLAMFVVSIFRLTSVRQGTPRWVRV